MRVAVGSHELLGALAHERAVQAHEQVADGAIFGRCVIDGGHWRAGRQGCFIRAVERGRKLAG